MDDSDSVHNLEKQLAVLEEVLAGYYYQLGKNIYELADRELAAIDNIVNDIIIVRKELSALQ